MEWNEVCCPHCKKAMRYDATICPHCRTAATPGELADRKKDLKGSVLGGCAVLILGALGLAYCSSGGDSQPEKPKVETAEDREDRLRANCLSGWDGSMRNMVKLLKDEVLNDPDSFQHDETKTTAPDAKGERTGVMTFRAKNGFGGYKRSSVTFTFDDKTCEVTSWKVQE